VVLLSLIPSDISVTIKKTVNNYFSIKILIILAF
jgi:hypothetical protein